MNQAKKIIPGLNRESVLSKLKQAQQKIVYRDREDEGAAEYHGELQTVIDTIEAGKTDEEIQAAADWVGVSLEHGR